MAPPQPAESRTGFRMGSYGFGTNEIVMCMIVQ
jgi:hypothetical protein